MLYLINHNILSNMVIGFWSWSLFFYVSINIFTWFSFFEVFYL